MAQRPKPVELKYICSAESRTDDVPIILLHGMGVSKENWLPIFEDLALGTKKQVCIADLRNHGESPWNSDEFDVAAMTEDVKLLIDRLKAPKVIVGGHSLGGKVAVHLALTYPERVEKVIVEDMRPNGVTSATLHEGQFFFKTLKELEKDIPQGVSEIEAKNTLLKIFNEHLQKIIPSFKPYEEVALMPIRCSNGKCQWSLNPILMDTFMTNIDALLNESSGRFDGPALFIYGGESKFKVGDDESNIKKLFPNAKLVEISGSDHMVHMMKKEEFTSEIIKFINEK